MNDNPKKTYDIEIDPLALGLTRSSMLMGVPIKLFFGNLMINILLCVDVHTFYGIPLLLILHGVMAKLSVKEPHFFFLYLKAFTQTPSVLNSTFWGKTNSYEPW